MTAPMTDAQVRKYLDRSFTPLKAAIDRADKSEISAIVARFKAAGRMDLADIALDTAVRALYPNGVPG